MFWLFLMWLAAISFAAGGAAWTMRGAWVPAIFSFVMSAWFVVGASVIGATLALTQRPNDDDDDTE